jgi:hypothetical protein
MAMISDMRPKAMPSFTSAFSERLRAIVGTLPANTAILEIGCDSDIVTFTISPSNHHSAVIKGEAACQGGINFRVGRATIVEASTSREQWFFQLCEAVFRSHFSESVSYSSTGRVLCSSIQLERNGQKIRLGGRQLFWWLFPNKRNEEFAYEPYY